MGFIPLVKKGSVFFEHCVLAILLVFLGFVLVWFGLVFFLFFYTGFCAVEVLMLWQQQVLMKHFVWAVLQNKGYPLLLLNTDFFNALFLYHGNFLAITQTSGSELPIDSGKNI